MKRRQPRIAPHWTGALQIVLVESRRHQLSIGKALTLSATYAGLLGGDTADHSLKGTLTYRF